MANLSTLGHGVQLAMEKEPVIQVNEKLVRLSLSPLCFWVTGRLLPNSHMSTFFRPPVNFYPGHPQVSLATMRKLVLVAPKFDF